MVWKYWIPEHIPKIREGFTSPFRHNLALERVHMINNRWHNHENNEHIGKEKIAWEPFCLKLPWRAMRLPWAEPWWQLLLWRSRSKLHAIGKPCLGAKIAKVRIKCNFPTPNSANWSIDCSHNAGLRMATFCPLVVLENATWILSYIIETPRLVRKKTLVLITKYHSKTILWYKIYLKYLFSLLQYHHVILNLIPILTYTTR